MPECPLNFRAKCGIFVAVFIGFMFKRVLAYKRRHVNTVRLRSYRLSLALVLVIATLLHQAGDVELNPGPKGAATRQTRLQSTSESSSGSADTGAMSTQTSAAKSRPTPTTEPSLVDIMTTLAELKTELKTDMSSMKSDVNRRLDTMNVNFDTLNDSVSSLREEMSHLSKELNDVKEENELLKAENRDLTNRLDEMENKLDEVEGRSRRKNLLFTGLKKQSPSRAETWEESETIVKDFIREKLGISEDIQFDRVHRLGKDVNSPIIARFTFFKDKQRIFTAKRKLKEREDCKSMFIGEDFSKKVRETRKKLVPMMKEMKKDKQKRVFLVYDHLVIDGETFYFDASSNDLKRKQ